MGSKTSYLAYFKEPLWRVSSKPTEGFTTTFVIMVLSDTSFSLFTRAVDLGSILFKLWRRVASLLVLMLTFSYEISYHEAQSRCLDACS